MMRRCKHVICDLIRPSEECWYRTDDSLITGHVCANCVVPLSLYPELQHVFVEPGECRLVTREEIDREVA